MDASSWDERYARSELVWSGEPNRFVAAAVGPPPDPGATALDVACGEGRNAVWLAEQGWTVTGVDFSAVALAKARDLAGARGVECRWIAADVTTWEAPQPFDLVLVVYLQLPPERLREAFSRAAAAVAPGGTLLAVGHHRDNLDHGHGGPPDAALLWDPSHIAGLLEGLEVAQAECVRRPVSTDDGERVALDALVRAQRPERAAP